MESVSRRDMETKNVLGTPLTMKQAPPAGLQSIINECMKIYPDQPNPLQVTTVVKFWLGGEEPLDYISMYSNPGDQELNIPAHWHYVTFGLSDLHGDERVHERFTSDDEQPRSGMGFELTFRLIKHAESKNPQKDMPPVWPANLLQMLARYVFHTGNRLCAGDNVPWKRSLDNTDSNIQHLLIAKDPQLNRIQTPYGWVDFCQVVGVTEEELDQATWWNGNGVLNLLKKDRQTGSAWLITDMARSKSVFELFPDTLEQLQENLETEGSDLAGINAEFSFKELPKVKVKIEKNEDEPNEKSELRNCVLETNVSLEDGTANKPDERPAKDCTKVSLMSIGTNPSLDMSCLSDAMQPIPATVTPMHGLQLTIAPLFAKYLVLAIRDRIRHGRHFTFKSETLAITFVSESVTGAVVTKSNPYALQGYWMQVLIPDQLIPEMVGSFECLAETFDATEGRKTFEWPKFNLEIVIDTPAQDKQPCLL